jgi:LIVCS family branched-chain amino acid:cation transporter
MFSMFFGSGNVIFPLLIGFKAQSLYTFAIFGFAITAVCVPFLGILGMIKFKGDRKDYFSVLGKTPAFILTLLMLMLMGPFGVIPRCVDVSYGGFELMYPTLPIWAFSAVFCLSIAILIWKKNSIVNIIGLLFTPIKLTSFIVLIVFGVWFSSPLNHSDMTPSSSFLLGLHKGYQTMDLLASFFFASTIYLYIKNTLGDKATDKNLARIGILASLVGGALLTVCYIGLILLGYLYSPFLGNVPQESMLAAIAQITLGKYAVPFIAITLAVSCLATATILADLFADFVQKDICSNKITRAQSVIFTILISFLLSLFGFVAICNWLGSILEWIYPFLMLFAIYQLVSHYKPTPQVIKI